MILRKNRTVKSLVFSIEFGSAGKIAFQTGRAIQCPLLSFLHCIIKSGGCVHSDWPLFINHYQHIQVYM